MNPDYDRVCEYRGPVFFSSLRTAKTFSILSVTEQNKLLCKLDAYCLKHDMQQKPKNTILTIKHRVKKCREKTPIPIIITK